VSPTASTNSFFIEMGYKETLISKRLKAKLLKPINVAEPTVDAMMVKAVRGAVVQYSSNRIQCSVES